jgi:hypothetical protein
MEWIILLIIALILLAWRINSEMSAIKPPSYPLIQKQQEEQSNLVPIEDEKDRTKKHSSVDDSYNDWSADSFSSSSFWDDNSTSSRNDDDIYTDPFYCYLPENIYYHMCHNWLNIFDLDDHWSSSNCICHNRSSIFDDHWDSSNWDDWISRDFDDWGSSSWDSWSSSSWDD